MSFVYMRYSIFIGKDYIFIFLFVSKQYKDFYVYLSIKYTITKGCGKLWYRERKKKRQRECRE